MAKIIQGIGVNKMGSVLNLVVRYFCIGTTSIFALNVFAVGYAFSDTHPAILSTLEVKNPYVLIYEKKLSAAKLEAQRRHRIASNEGLIWEQIRSLGENGAVSAMDVDAQETKWKVSNKRAEIADAYVLKAAALLAIAGERTRAGLEMPVCKVGN